MRRHGLRKTMRAQRRLEAAIIAAAKRAAKRYAKAKLAGTAKATTNAASSRSPAHKPQLGLRGTLASPNKDQKAYSADALWRSIFSDSSYLGGPRPRPKARKQGLRAATNRADLGTRRSQFLHAIHKRACSIFGTVLGPDANYAHRHHFHLDMQKRRLGPFCR